MLKAVFRCRPLPEVSALIRELARCSWCRLLLAPGVPSRRPQRHTVVASSPPFAAAFFDAFRLASTSMQAFGVRRRAVSSC